MDNETSTIKYILFIKTRPQFWTWWSYWKQAGEFETPQLAFDEVPAGAEFQIMEIRNG